VTAGIVTVSPVPLASSETWQKKYGGDAKLFPFPAIIPVVKELAQSPRHLCRIIPSILHPFSHCLLPSRSTSNLSATSLVLPRKQHLPPAVHQARVPQLTPTCAKTVLPATHRSVFPLQLSGRPKHAAALQIHLSHPCLAIAIILHPVKYGTTDVHPRLACLRQFTLWRPNPACQHPGTR